MKNGTVTISFEPEKLKALQFYAAKKDANLQDELNEFLQKLYEKYVPASTREYIESQMEQVREKPKRTNKAAVVATSAATNPVRPQISNTGE